MFRRMTQIAVASQDALAPILGRFSEVILIDSSTVALPDSQAERFRGCGGSHGGGRSALKLQTELDLRSGALRTVQIEEGRDTDGASSRQQAKPASGSLRISDLGYFNLSVFRAIAAAAAYYLSRIQYHTTLYVDGQKADSLINWLKRQGSTVVDRWIELGGDQRLNCRLIAWRLPKETANRRRQKLRKKLRRKSGKQPTLQALAACDWMFLMTNVPCDQLSVKEAIVLYRSRWQIELLFKRWKSLGSIDQMDGRNDYFHMTRLWARLCAVVIQHWLTIAVAWSPLKNLSLCRITKLTRQFAKDIAVVLSTDGDFTLLLNRLANMAEVSCKRNKRSKPGTFELLRNPTELNYTLT